MFKTKESVQQRVIRLKHDVLAPRALTQEQMEHMEYVRRTFDTLKLQSETDPSPFDFHTVVLTMGLGQGVMATLEKELLNRSTLSDDVKHMVFFGALAEMFRRSVRNNG